LAKGIDHCRNKPKVKMKKKNLRALNSIENWLGKELSGSANLKSSFETIRQAIEALPDAEAKTSTGVLPKPAEIAGEPNTFALYSDGGCRGNPGPGAFAFVVQENDGSIVVEGVEFESYTTNNKMELSGPLNGLHKLKEILPEIGREPLLTKIKVITDSKYVVDGMKSWVQGWKSRGWKKADGKAPENLELWQGLDQIRNSFMEIEWAWVKGHGGHPQNEYCDQKANEAMDANIS
jgi:ribonuclease HI